MESEKFTPHGWHWKITPEQIEKIKERDRDTVNKVYFDNYDKFKRMAKRYCSISNHRDFVEDCVQQIYVDMIDYDYTNSKTLFWGIRHSFYRAIGSTNVHTVSLDSPLCIDGNDFSLLDTILLSHNVDFEFEFKDNELRALELIAAQTHLSDKNKDILTAIAFNCLAYRGLFAYEYGKARTA